MSLLFPENPGEIIGKEHEKLPIHPCQSLPEARRNFSPSYISSSLTVFRGYFAPVDLADAELYFTIHCVSVSLFYNSDYYQAQNTFAYPVVNPKHVYRTTQVFLFIS